MDLNENTNWNEKNPDGTYKYNDDFLAEQLKKAGAAGNKKTMEAITKAGEVRFKEKYTQPTVQEKQAMTNPVPPKTQSAPAPTASTPSPASVSPTPTVSSNQPTIPERTLKPQVSGATISNADNSNARTYIEAKPDKIAELKEKYPDGYYENGKFYYNSENDEKRHELALDDIKENRNYTTAQAPSKHESDLKNKTGFDEKDYKGDYVYTEEELERDLDKYGDSDKALAEAIEAELERRDAESKAKPVETKSEEVEGTIDNKSYDSMTEEEPVGMKSDTENKKPKIDDKASREAYNTKADALNQAIDEAKERISDLDGMYDDLRKEAEAELDKHENAANLAEFLPKFAIQRYLEGEFGDRGSAKALGTLGYFLIDKIGSGLINASLIARGMSPSQKSALQEYNEKRMTDALSRDNSNRAKINEEKINNIIKDSDALRQAGFDTEITLGNDMTSKYLQQHADQIDSKVYLRLMNEIGDWYEGLPDSQKVVVRRAMLAMSTDPDTNSRALLEDQLADVRLREAQTEEEIENATYNKAYVREKRKYVSSLAKTEQKVAEETLNKVIKENNLSDKQAEMLMREVQSLEKDINWKDTEKATGLLGGVIRGIIGLK